MDGTVAPSSQADQPKPVADHVGEGWTSPPLRIVSAREGRRRAGLEHARQAQLHPAGSFTLDQVELLESDPVLTVERFTDEQYAAAVAAKASQA